MDILERIVARKNIEIQQLPERNVTPSCVREARARNGMPRDFFQALRAPRHGRIGLIAELKKASPSAGVICPDFDPVRIARQYEAGGATCLSVLTDERFFQGSLEYLKAVRQAVPLPLLRKDFLIDPRQILEAAEWGADAVLLIVAILDDGALKELLDLAVAGEMAALIEVHDDMELERALAAGARLIGVNNRDLKTFKVDLSVTERLATHLAADARGKGVLLVAESGIHTRRDVERLETCGAKAVLVGESLMRQGAPADKVRELLGTDHP